MRQHLLQRGAKLGFLARLRLWIRRWWCGALLFEGGDALNQIGLFSALTIKIGAQSANLPRPGTLALSAVICRRRLVRFWLGFWFRWIDLVAIGVDGPKVNVVIVNSAAVIRQRRIALFGHSDTPGYRP